MVDELKKYWSELHVKILVLLVFIVSIGVSIAPIKSFSIIESPDNTNRVEGKAAIQVLKERYENSKGELSIDRINEILAYYQSIPEQDRAFLETDIKYPGVLFLLTDAYSPGMTSEIENLNKIENGNDFYNRNTIKITEILNNLPDDYKAWEKDIILKKANSVETPFRIDFSRQWIDVYQSLNILFIVIAISAIVVGSKLFSYEKEKKMDMILVTFGEKKLKKIGINKVLALLTFLSIVFLMSVLIVSVITFSAVGIDGMSSQIQIEFFTSIHQLTFGSAYLLALFMGWLCLMAIGILVATINAFMQKSYLSLIIGFLVTFLPIVIIKFDSIPVTIGKVLNIQPINGFAIIENIASLQIYKFFNIQMLTTTAIIFYTLIILIVCFLITPQLFILRIKDY
ncbi:hypothetical protein ACS127_10585 [Amphibacillus sp. Q70]|uniref:hypothetical protein n=1 Tax=Amphibacillus sp. Q70 TaxID=3453416 RepID=UPI003F839A41